MKYYGFFLLLGIFAAATVEIFLLLVLPIFLQLFFCVASLASLVYGIFLFKKHDWKDAFLLDALLQKKQRVVKELYHEVLLIFAAILLIFPGLFTDVGGLILLNPVLRNSLIQILFFDRIL